MGVPNDLVVPTDSMSSIDLPDSVLLGDPVFKTDINHFTYFGQTEVEAFARNFLLG